MDAIKEAMIREEDTGEINPALDPYRERPALPKFAGLHMPDDLVVVRNRDADEAGDYRVMKHCEAVMGPQWQITDIDPKDFLND